MCWQFWRLAADLKLPWRPASPAPSSPISGQANNRRGPFVCHPDIVGRHRLSKRERGSGAVQPPRTTHPKVMTVSSHVPLAGGGRWEGAIKLQRAEIEPFSRMPL